MALNYEQATDTIARLRQELKDRNQDIHIAATVGKDLLEKTERLSRDAEAVQAENEILKQDKYSLQLDLETQVQTVNTQASEIEFLRVQNDTAAKQLEIFRKETITQKRQIDNFKKERTDFEKSQEDALFENQSLKKKIDSLESQLKAAAFRSSVPINLEVVSEEKDKESDINYYMCQNKKLNEALSQLQCDLESTKLAEKRLANKVKELEEGVSDRDKELAGFSVEIQKAREYAMELQGEIEVLKLEQVDVNRRGNSVFGEIDDRRKIIEKEYKLLMKRHESLANKYKAIKKELISCKGQMAILFSMKSHTHQDSYIDKLEDQLSSARREIENLTEQRKKMTRERQQAQQEKVLSGSDEYDYLRVMNELAEQKIKELENDLISVHIQKIADNDELDRTRREMYGVQVELDEANHENMKLNHKIKELTLTVETEAPTLKETEVIVREFDPNKVTVRKCEGKSNQRMKIINENESCQVKDTMEQAVVIDKETYPDLSNQAVFRPILHDFNDKAIRDAASQNAENNLKEKKTNIHDHIAHLDSISFKEGSRVSSSRKERKEGQCAQQ